MSSVHLAEKNIDLAVAEAKKAIEKDPRAIDAFIHLGGIYLLSSRVEMAKQTFKEAMRVDPASVRARNTLAEFYIRTGRDDLAEAELVEVTKIAPGNPHSFIVLGDFYARRNRPVEAEKQFLKAVEVDPVGGRSNTEGKLPKKYRAGYCFGVTGTGSPSSAKNAASSVAESVHTASIAALSPSLGASSTVRPACSV